MNSDEDDITKTPQKNIDDGLHIITKAGLSAIPIVGGSVASLFNDIITPSIEIRRNQWIQRIAEELVELQKKVKYLEGKDFEFDDRVMTVFLYASQSAIRNHQEEKLESLQNAILNSALNPSIDENIQLMFVNYIDTLTPWHITLLKYFYDPMKWLDDKDIKTDISGGSALSGVNIAIPDLSGKESISSLIITDLINKGLIQNFEFRGSMSRNGIFAPRTSELGNKFIGFISTPKIMQN